jgi:hypothetical protein
MKSALINIWFGNLPNYFPFFAKSCLINHPEFHWFIFTDIPKEIKYNKSVTLKPYSWDELFFDCDYLNLNREIRTLQRWPKFGWPCRLALLWKKQWEDFDFLGTSDCDVIFGKLKNHMPDHPEKYDLISGHSGKALNPPQWRNCASFSLYQKKSLQIIKNYSEQREEALDDNYIFSDYFEKFGKVFHTGKNIQPVGESLKGYPYFMDYTAMWNCGEISVEGVSGGFWHLLPTKTHHDFKVRGTEKSDIWIMNKYGIHTKIYL